ncbi:MAG: hypothetical protein CM15mP93_03100 [Thiotrichaceae bacterium]|nr:MAG: hypothetical protein CM15mP93_03100 [Thiotrichaceae bacterium]
MALKLNQGSKSFPIGGRLMFDTDHMDSSHATEAKSLMILSGEEPESISKVLLINIGL